MSGFYIRKSSIIILFCAFMWCMPQGVSLMLIRYASILNVIRCVLWILAFSKAILMKCKISRFCKELHTFWFVFLLCILCADFTITNVNTWLIPFCSICGFSLLVEIYDLERVIGIFYKYFYALSVINLILLFSFPQGFPFQISAYDGLNTYESFSNFISTDNTYAPFLMCFLLFGEICRKRYSKKVYIGMWLISSVTVIRIWSGTCIIGFVVYIFLVLHRNMHISIWKIKIWKIAAGFSVIFILIYYFHIQNLFSFIIVDILGKDLTLTRRIGLWTNAIEMIRENWLFGWGNMNRGAIILRDYYYWYAHNLVLDILLEGGILTLVAFLYLLFRLAKILNEFTLNCIVQNCLMVIAVFMVLNLVESYFNSMYFYIPMIIAAAATRDRQGIMIMD